jgi:predicted RNA-binding protein with PUA-like domain
MANRWLFKTEPSVYSFQQLQKDKKTMWDGVKNNLALKNLKDIKKGDEILIYHTADEKAAVGIARGLWAVPIRTRARRIPACWSSISNR